MIFQPLLRALFVCAVALKVVLCKVAAYDNSSNGHHHQSNEYTKTSSSSYTYADPSRKPRELYCTNVSHNRNLVYTRFKSDKTLNVNPMLGNQLYNLVRTHTYNESGGPLIMLFVGHTGTGKTYTARQVARYLSEPGKPSVLERAVGMMIPKSLQTPPHKGKSVSGLVQFIQSDYTEDNFEEIMNLRLLPYMQQCQDSPVVVLFDELNSFISSSAHTKHVLMRIMSALKDGKYTYKHYMYDLSSWIFIFATDFNKGTGPYNELSSFTSLLHSGSLHSDVSFEKELALFKSNLMSFHETNYKDFGFETLISSKNILVFNSMTDKLATDFLQACADKSGLRLDPSVVEHILSAANRCSDCFDANNRPMRFIEGGVRFLSSEISGLITNLIPIIEKDTRSVVNTKDSKALSFITLLREIISGDGGMADTTTTTVGYLKLSTHPLNKEYCSLVGSSHCTEEKELHYCRVKEDEVHLLKSLQPHRWCPKTNTASPCMYYDKINYTFS